MITAAFTGMRWGEITGLAKHDCHPEQLYLQVDPETGALHEVRGALWLGPPKTETAARRIDLPPFLATLLQQVMDGHDHQQVLVTADELGIQEALMFERMGHRMPGIAGV